MLEGMKMFREKRKKSVIALLTVMALLLGGINISVYAEDTVYYNGNEYALRTSGDYEYCVVGDEAIIVSYNGTASAISIPSEMGGFKVTEIAGKWNRSGNSGSGAFQNNSSMQTVTIPETVKTISKDAFRGCSGLQQVLIGSGVTVIGANAFRDCAFMQRIQFNGNQLLVINEYAFYACLALDNLNIPTSVTSIGNMAFAKCEALSEITIPDSVVEFGGGVFFKCTALSSAIIGNGITELVHFRGYESSNWGGDNYNQGSFEGCTSLTSVLIGSGVKTIGYDAFAGCGLLELTIPDNVVMVEDYAFYECKNLIKVTIGDNVTAIGNHVFTNCIELNEVSIGKRVRTIGDKAFASCSSLTSITIPSNVISLGGGAFYNCQGLGKVVIGNGVTELGRYRGYSNVNWGGDSYNQGTFEGCINLSEVNIGNGVKTISYDAFAGTALIDVYIPDNVITIEDCAFNNCYTLQKIVIGDGVTSMGGSIFESCKVLTDITIGKGVISIGDRAFVGCDSLASIIIPSNVTSLGGGVFYSCQNLKKAIIGNGVTEIKRYRGYSNKNWGGDNYNQGIFDGCIVLEDVALGSGLTTIEEDSFAGTALKSLLIPAKVAKINGYAFASMNSLQNIYFTGVAPSSLADTIFKKGNLSEYDSAPVLSHISGKTGFSSLKYQTQTFTPVTVKFDLNEKDIFAITPTDQIMSPEGGYVIEPIPPAGEKYIFAGWYADSACTKKWNFAEDKVVQNTTLYAKWNSVDTVPPQSPKELSAFERTDTSISVSWSAVSGAKGYKVYVDGNLVTTTAITECQYVISGLEADTVYEINITAVNDKGESESSLIIVANTSEKGTTPNPTEEPGITEEPTASPTPTPGTTEEPTTSPTPTPGMNGWTKGDVNGDGQIKLTDAQLALRAALGILTLEGDVAWAADANGDGEIKLADAQMTLRAALGIIQITNYAMAFNGHTYWLSDMQFKWQDA